MYHWYLLHQRKHQAPRSASADSCFVAPGTRVSTTAAKTPTLPMTRSAFWV